MFRIALFICFLSPFLLYSQFKDSLESSTPEEFINANQPIDTSDLFDSNQSLEKYKKTQNLASIGYYWSRAYHDSITIQNLKSTNDSLINWQRFLYYRNEDLRIENRNLDQDLQLYKLLLEKLPSNGDTNLIDNDLYLFQQLLINKQLNNRTDSILFLREIISLLERQEEKVDTVVTTKYFIHINPIRLESSHYNKIHFQVILNEEEKGNLGYLIYNPSKQTTPYFNYHPEFHVEAEEKIGEGSELSWDFTYYTSHYGPAFNVEMRFAGYKIQGDKIEVEIGEDKFSIANLWHQILFFLTRSEVMFTIILTLLANINKVIDESKALKEKLFKKIAAKVESD